MANLLELAGYVQKQGELGRQRGEQSRLASLASQAYTAPRADRQGLLGQMAQTSPDAAVAQQKLFRQGDSDRMADLSRKAKLFVGMAETGNAQAVAALYPQIAQEARDLGLGDIPMEYNDTFLPGLKKFASILDGNADNPYAGLPSDIQSLKILQSDPTLAALDRERRQASGMIPKPFETSQVGSSAMPHKVNARNCERICGFHTILTGLAAMTGGLAGHQWNEGDVSCSVVRRVALPDAFFAIDGLLETFLTVLRQMDVFAAVIAAEAERNLPFLSTTTILMEAVKHGAGRETAHEAIKEHALAAAKALRSGQEPDLLGRLAGDKRIGLAKKQLQSILSESSRFVGAAPEQVDAMVRDVQPLARRYRGAADYRPGKLL